MRRFLSSMAVAVTALAVPIGALGQGISLTIADDTCSAPVDNVASLAEVYAVKLTSAGDDGSDILFNIQNKGPSPLPATLGTGLDGSVAPNWRVAGGPTTPPGQFVFLYHTYPEGAFGPAGGRGNWIGVDTGEPSSTGGGFGAILVTKVGDSLKSTYGANPGPPVALDLALGAGSVTVDTGAGNRTYPYGSRSGIEVVFSPIAEVTPNGGTITPATGVSFCTYGGENPIPGAPAADPKGHIIGYNVYRAPDGPIPTRAQIGATANFVRFIPTNLFDLSAGDTAGADGGGPLVDTNGDTIGDVAQGDSTPAPAQGTSGAFGFAGVEQPNDTVARRHSGDDMVIFSDALAGLPDGTGFWYAFQPVIGGNLSTFGSTFVGWSGRNELPGDHTMDTDADTVMDSISVDDIAGAAGRTPEFISPQAEIGLPGLGLTHGGLPVLSAPVRGAINAAAAMGELSLEAVPSGTDMNLTFSTAVEGQNVSGFNVYRVMGDNRVRVNDSLILARGGEGNVYTLVDGVVRTSSRRTTTAVASSYLVEIVYSDGTPSKMVGPFSVGTDSPAGATRRR